MKSKKRVLFLTHTDFKFDSRILKEAKALMSVGDFFVFCIGVADNAHTKSLQNELPCDYHSIDLLARKMTFIPLAIRHVFEVIELSSRMFVVAFRFRPNIIHAHDVVVLPLSFLLKIFTSCRLVYDAHELESCRIGMKKTSGFFTRVCEKTIWPFVDAFITVSDSIRNWYFEVYGEKHNCAVILNSPLLSDEENVDLIKDEYLRDKFNIPHNEKVFIYVGMCAEKRGIEIILQIFQKKLNAHVVFMGDGPLVGLIIAEASANRYVHYHPPVAHSHVVAIVKSADVGLCLIENASLSYYYSLPNKLFEYCFAGLPIIASDFPEISKIVNENALGLCCSLQCNELEKTIIQFIDSTSSFAFDTSILKKYSWNCQEEKLIKLYRNLDINKALN